MINYNLFYKIFNIKRYLSSDMALLGQSGELILLSTSRCYARCRGEYFICIAMYKRSENIITIIYQLKINPIFIGYAPKATIYFYIYI